jgi:hypothetical protein
MKWVFTAEDARAIADKLRALHELGRSGHEGVEFYHNGRMIFRFGIRRGSGEHGHNFIPRYMHLSQKDCWLFRKCDISLDQYIEILKAKQIILD